MDLQGFSCEQWEELFGQLGFKYIPNPHKVFQFHLWKTHDPILGYHVLDPSSFVNGSLDFIVKFNLTREDEVMKLFSHSIMRHLRDYIIVLLHIAYPHFVLF